MLPHVSIVIPTHNNHELLRRCVESALRTDYPSFEIIVVDDNSSDCTPDYLRMLASTHNCVRIVRNSRNLGHAGATNRGAMLSDAPFIAKIDEDVVVDPGWLKELMLPLATQSDLGIAQSASFVYDSQELIPHPSVADMDYIGRCYYRISDTTEEAFFPIAYAIVMSRDLYWTVGGFHDGFFMYYEEVDLGWKVRLMGFHVKVIHSSVVRHLGAYQASNLRTVKNPRPRYLWHAIKNHLATLIMNYEPMNVVKYLPLAVVTHFGEAMFDLLKNHQTFTLRAFLKALGWCVTNLPSLMTKRRFVQEHVRRIPDRALRKSMVRPRIPYHKLT